MAVIILLFVCLFALLAWKRLDWAAMFIIIALPSYLVRFDVFGIPFTVLETMILTTFVVWLLKYSKVKDFFCGRYKISEYLANRSKRLPYPFGIEICLAVIVAFFAVGVSGFSNEALGIWKAYFFEPALFFILILNLFSLPDEKQKLNIDKIIFSLAISALAVSVLAIYQQIAGDLISNPLWQAAATRRVVSFFGYPNAVGLYLGPITIILIGYLFFSQIKKFQLKVKNILVCLAIVLSVTAIYFAHSEGALIGMAAALIIFGLLANKYLRWSTVGLIMIFGLTIFSYQPAKNYVIEKVALNDFSGQVRKLQWTETWRMLKDGRLILGAGLSNYQNIIKPYHQEGFFYNKDKDPDFRRKIVLFNLDYKKQFWQPLEIYMYPHNIILNFWSELGLLGVLLFIWIMIKYFYTSILNLRMNNYRYLNIGLTCAMIVIIVHGLVDVPYFKNDLAVMFWLWVAMQSVINLHNQNAAE